MVLILYITLFAAVMAYRRFRLGGYFLKSKGGILERIVYTGKHRRRLYAEIGIEMDMPAYFSITGERWHHRLLKTLGLATELQTGDAELDKKLFFISDTPQHLGQLMQSADFGRHIRSLFMDVGVKSLRAFGTRIWVRTETRDANTYNAMYKGNIVAALRKITADAAREQSFYAASEDDRVLPPRFAALILMAAHAAFFSVALFGGIPALIETAQVLNRGAWVAFSGMASAAALGLWAITLLFFVGRSSWAPLVIADFFIFGLVGIVGTCFFSLREANMSFDTAQTEVVTRKIVQQNCTLTCSKGSGKRRRSSSHALSYAQCLTSARWQTVEAYKARDYKCSSRATFSYHIFVDPWLESQTVSYEFKAREDLYDRVQPGQSLDIPMHPGALGLAWVDTDDITPHR